MIRLLFISFLFASCEIIEGLTEEPTHPDLLPYYEMWADEARERGYEPFPINIIYRNRPEGVNATCLKRLIDTRIEVDKNSWIYSTAAQKEKTIFHELGHAMGLQHSNDNNSIMYGFTISDSYYWSHREQLLDELFLGE